MSERGKAYAVLAANTVAFTACFAVWVMYGVLVTFLVDGRVYAFSKSEMGWLIGIPILTGSVFRLPVGILTDKYGGRPVFAAVMLFSAAACWLTSWADGFWAFALAGLGFGFAGTGFAVGIAYTSLWFPRHQQGTALGIFGTGNAGAALTSVGAPHLLRFLTGDGANLDGWRQMPRIYAIALLVTTVAFWLSTHPRKVEHGHELTIRERLRPLEVVRVWRFGLYYFLVFGGFVALASWLIPYYVNAYGMSVATAGLLASVFSLPSGVIRALGGWLSDRYGARSVMYWVLGGCAVGCLLLVVPRMDVFAPGEGVMAAAPGIVDRVTPDAVVVGGRTHALRPKPQDAPVDADVLVWPASRFWQEPAVKTGDRVVKKQLLARGVTHVYFQANVWIFTVLVFVVGILMGIGKAAVYKHIPEYFPREVGVVGGIVGVLGGLGGFLCPILFGYVLQATGIWTTCWMILALLSAGSLAWMHAVVRRLLAERAPHLHQQIDRPHAEPHRSVAAPAPAGVPAALRPEEGR
ncbi:NarK/NasA family nitrate transporter [Acidobacteria bacterium ACD]|nr:MAG: NarK/NasA family nitrate transporter [Acidobacteriota bacterium]MDL1949904.1 NarK/NasA family nitrate transporter [Acidobacteria bacterium ACD]